MCETCRGLSMLSFNDVPLSISVFNRMHAWSRRASIFNISNR